MIKSIQQMLYVMWRLIRIPIIAFIVIGTSSGLVAATSTYLVFNNQVPVEIPDEPVEFIESSPSVVYDINGNQIASFRSFDLFESVEYEDIPDTVISAVVSNEDRRFYEHNGADIEGILRAGLQNFQTGGKGQGGSTITQQVARGLYLSPEKSYERKAREILLALQLETVMTKEEILTAYLNLAFFGEGAYGISAAAEIYFGKDLQDVTISEAASLVAAIPAPSVRNPRENPDFNNEQRKNIIGKTYLEGYISFEEYEEEIEKNIHIADGSGYVRPNSTVVVPAPRTDYGSFPYFVDAVRREILKSFGEETLFSGGLKIYTTLDPATQQLAVDKSQEFITGERSVGVQSSIVMIDNDTGYIMAMVGGWDWENNKNNLALGGSLGFQPGSSLKPFIYTQALEAGFFPESIIAAPQSWRVPTCLSGKCDISGGPSGTDVTTLNTALQWSYNTPWAIMAYNLDTNNVAEYMKAYGVDLREAENYNATLALGAYEVSPLGLATGYTTLAREGSKIEPTAIVKIVKNDEVLLDNTAREGTQVVNKDLARYTAEAMFAVTEEGTGRRAALPNGRVAGKTGTAQDYRAAWFSGFTPDYTTIVWVGNPDIPTRMSGFGGFGNITGGSLPAKIWKEFMSDYLQGESWEWRELPEYPRLNEDEDIENQIATTTSTTTPIEPGKSKTITNDTVECVNQCSVFPTLPEPTTTTTIQPTTTTTTTPTTAVRPPFNPVTTTTRPQQSTFFTTP